MGSDRFAGTFLKLFALKMVFLLTLFNFGIIFNALITAFLFKQPHRTSLNWTKVGKFCPTRVGQQGFIASAPRTKMLHRHLAAQNPPPSATPWERLSTHFLSKGCPLT